MSQNFHDEIKAALAAQGINAQTPQAVRDRAILAHNQSQGRDPFMGGGRAPMPQQVAAPAAAPVQPSNIEQSIAAQLGEQMPIPPSRPAIGTPAAVPVQQMGDASVMEAMQGVPQSPGASPLEQSIAEQVAPQSAVPAATPAAVQAPVAGPEQPTADASGNNLVAFLAAAGGVAGAAALYQRFVAGDADAARTFAAHGMDPNDFAMFADEPLNQRSGRYEYTIPDDEGGKQDKPQQSNGTKSAPKPQAQKSNAPQSKTPTSATAPAWFTEMNKEPDAQRFAPGPQATPGADQPLWVQRWIQNMEQSIPAARPKVKAK